MGLVRSDTGQHGPKVEPNRLNSGWTLTSPGVRGEIGSNPEYSEESEQQVEACHRTIEERQFKHDRTLRSWGLIGASDQSHRTEGRIQELL